MYVGGSGASLARISLNYNKAVERGARLDHKCSSWFISEEIVAQGSRPLAL